MHYREKSHLSTTSISWLQNTAKVFYDFILDLFFPRNCILCKKDGVFFCASCRGKMPIDTTPMINHTFSLWRYDHETVRKALWELKYRGKRGLARDLAESLYDKILETLSEEELFQNPAGKEECSDRYMVVPVPIHKKRRKERGYNQSELLAKELSLLNHSLFILENKVLLKTKATPSQVSVKDREKRLKNIKGSFTIKNPEKIIEKKVLIVDDITTTGATLSEARRLLIKSGAKKVWCVTVAH
ncbi:MAG: ComF family protein [Candidatus Parcubacteria bacterium]|nr:ComF family protein [Candidatus Parcubacteria bacterium]